MTTKTLLALAVVAVLVASSHADLTSLIIGTISGTLNTFAALAKIAFDAAAAGIGAGVGFIVSVLFPLMTNIIRFFGSLAQYPGVIINGVMPAFNGLLTVLANGIGSIFGAFSAAFGNILAGIESGKIAINDAIIGTLGGYINTLSMIFSSIISAFSKIAFSANQNFNTGLATLYYNLIRDTQIAVGDLCKLKNAVPQLANLTNVALNVSINVVKALAANCQAAPVTVPECANVTAIAATVIAQAACGTQLN